MLEERISCWVKMRRKPAYLKKFICRLRGKFKGRNSSNNTDTYLSYKLQTNRMQKLPLSNCTKEGISRVK